MTRKKNIVPNTVDSQHLQKKKFAFSTDFSRKKLDSELIKIKQKKNLFSFDSPDDNYNICQQQQQQMILSVLAVTLVIIEQKNIIKKYIKSVKTFFKLFLDVIKKRRHFM